MDLATRVVRQQVITAPAVTEASQDPTVTRYGWVPFKAVNLCGPDGTVAIPAQPYEIAGADGSAIPNPYFRELPKGQLIPFPTFTRVEQQPSQDRRDGLGRPMLDSVPRQVSALEAIVLVGRAYGDQGFTRLNSLTGVDQITAQRIFTVVQPFDYPIGRLLDELNFGAEERIDSAEELVFDLGQGQEYVIDCLRNEKERETARNLVAEMLIGADVAFSLADETLNTTEASIIEKAASGKGKPGPDKHDRYLAEELERSIVNPIRRNADNSSLENKVDFLVNKEVGREQQAEIDRLRAENEKLRQQNESKPLPVEDYAFYCGAIKADGQPCRISVENEGERCRHHPQENDVT